MINTTMGPGFFIFFKTKKEEPKPNQNVSRGSGGTNGIRREISPMLSGYRGFHKDQQRESDLGRIQAEENLIVEFISIIVSKGIL